MNPNDALRLLAAKLSPSPTEVRAAQSHFSTISTRLMQTFGASRFIPIGSHARGTAIGKHSDIDFLAVLPRKSARWGGDLVAPQTFLGNVARDLRDRYTSTSVRRDVAAVVLRFSGGEHAVDVVPGIFLEMRGSRPAYLIPCEERWTETSPETHDVIFDEANRRSGRKLGTVSRLIKGWKFGRTPHVPLSSFYTDVLLATTDLAAGVKSHAEFLHDFFGVLIRRDVRGLRDPAGISGLITACPTEAARDRLYSAAQTARQHAEAALHAERRGNHAEANRQWGIVFNRSL